MDLPGLTDFNGLDLRRTFELQLPAFSLAPTYTFVPQCCGNSLAIAYYYELKFDVKARGIFTDFKVSTPVFVGTEPFGDQPPLFNSYVEMPTASAPAYEYDEPPPAYESIVNNEKH